MRTPIVALAALLLCVTAARADDEQRYGGQLLLADLAAVGVGAAAIKVQSRELGAVAVGMWVLTPQLIHALHGGVDRVPRSLGLRIFAPLGLGVACGLLVMP